MKSESETSVKISSNGPLNEDSSKAVRSQIRNLQAYLKERQIHRAKYYGQPIYSVSSSSLNVDGYCPERFKPKQSNNAFNRPNEEVIIEENAKPLSGYVNNARTVRLAWHIPQYNCSVCRSYPELVGRGQLGHKGSIAATSMKLPVEEAPAKNNYISKMYVDSPSVTMPGNTSAQISSFTFRAAKKENLDNYYELCPTDFSGIMNNLFQLMIRAIYQIFLVILQIIPFVEALPLIYNFTSQGLVELRNTSDRKEFIGKACVFFFHISAIIAVSLFIVCVILLPVISLGHSILGKLFFFI